jgi:hypothetical protein
VIAREQFLQPAAWMVLALGALTFVTTVISGIDYVLRYGEAALLETSSRRTRLPAGRTGLR